MQIAQDGYPTISLILLFLEYSHNHYYSRSSHIYATQAAETTQPTDATPANPH